MGNYNKNKICAAFAALLVCSTLTGCSLDGDDGETGAQGPAGEQGPAGQPGQDGQDALQGITLQVIGRATLGAVGGAEIVQYHAATKTIYATNGSNNTISIIPATDTELSASALENPFTDTNLTINALDLPSEVNGVPLGSLTSIAVHDDLLAVAIAAEEHNGNGYILFYNGLNESTPAFVTAVEAGNLPDMVTFTPDGSKVLVANEGEPSDDYTVDPQGSVSVIAIDDNLTPAETAIQVTFEQFNGMREQMENQGMHFPNPSGRTINGVTIATTVAQDLEPEYISATNTQAYVTLQENNALAVINLDDLSVNIVGLGVKDWSKYSIDVQENDAVSFGQYQGLYGLYMPDSIANYQWKGATFLVTANEGDAREYMFDAEDEATCLSAGGLEFDDGDCLAYLDEIKVEDLTAEPNSLLSDLQAQGEADDLRVTRAKGDADGDGEYDAAYAYGTRSFTIWDRNGMEVFDSGDDFERITASVHGVQFNNGDEENEGDSRSENKGPEPEAITVGEISGRTYAFIGTERMGGIFVYDVTNPYDARFVDYVINRDLTDGLEVGEAIGDLAPESLVFVSPEESATGNALLIVGNEVSGTVAVWQILPQ